MPSWEMRLPRICDFSGESWFPGKCYFLDNVTSLEFSKYDKKYTWVKILANNHMKHSCRRYIRTFPSSFSPCLDIGNYWQVSWVSGKLTSWKSWFLGKNLVPGKSDFPEKFTSRRSLLPRKVDFPEKLSSWESCLLGKVDFPEKLIKSVSRGRDT